MAPLGPLLDLLALERLPRTGWLVAGVSQPESVAAHSLGVACCVLGLAPRTEPALDVDRAVTLALVHDAPEALLTDLPKRAAELLPAGAKQVAEARAAQELLGPLSDLALRRSEEYRAAETREARFVRLCDKLHLGVRLVGYLRTGVRGLMEFRAGIEELDCSEFAACEELRGEILKALEGPFE